MCHCSAQLLTHIAHVVTRLLRGPKTIRVLSRLSNPFSILLYLYPSPHTMASNPIISGFNPDPTICRVGDDYFLATSTFEYFPGVPIYHSRDLVNWTHIGHALNRRSQLDLRNVNPGGGVWAPTLRYHNGTFYLATAVVYGMTKTVSN